MIDINQNTTFGFPFSVDGRGGIRGSGGDEAIRGKIIQVLFTAPGERVLLPEFGCGLFNLVFEPNNDILAAAMEFTITQALARWLADDILVDTVSVNPQQETVSVEIAYTKKIDLTRQAVHIQFK
jgi:phage baseplate assembly protein W